jgi:hypothetical protein
MHADLHALAHAELLRRVVRHREARLVGIRVEDPVALGCFGFPCFTDMRTPDPS